MQSNVHSFKLHSFVLPFDAAKSKLEWEYDEMKSQSNQKIHFYCRQAKYSHPDTEHDDDYMMEISSLTFNNVYKIFIITVQ